VRVLLCQLARSAYAPPLLDAGRELHTSAFWGADGGIGGYVLALDGTPPHAVLVATCAENTLVENLYLLEAERALAVTSRKADPAERCRRLACVTRYLRSLGMLGRTGRRDDDAHGELAQAVS
jgi:hypothetical protein